MFTDHSEYYHSPHPFSMLVDKVRHADLPRDLELNVVCKKPYQCQSNCCLPEMDKDWHVKKVDPVTGEPIRACKPIPKDQPQNPCTVAYYADLDYWVIAIVSIVIIVMITCSCRRYWSNTSKINILNYKIKKTDEKIKEALREHKADRTASGASG